MESNHQCPPMPNYPNRERASNTEEANLTLEEVTTEDAYRPNNQLLTYHRSGPDGKYVPVGLSLGFRFDPDDDELIQYLEKRISEEEATCIFIPNVNVYEHSPEELTDAHQSVGREEWYFFSTRDRKYLNGTRPKRAAGNGYWKATGVDKKIYDHNAKCIGSKKCLVFYEGKPPKGQKTNWVMHEYVAVQHERQPRDPGDMLLDDCVLCHIHKKSNRSPNGKKQTAASESDTNQASPPMQLAVLQPNTPMPLQILDPVLHQNPPTAPQQNPQVPQQNLHAIVQYNPQAGSHNQGGQLDYQSESIPEHTRDEIQYDNLENSHEPFSDLISMDMDENLTYSPAFQDAFGQFNFPWANYNYFDNPYPSTTFPGTNYNYFDNPYPSMNYLNPNPPPFDNKDHPPDGHRYKKARSTSDNINPREQS